MRRLALRSALPLGLTLALAACAGTDRTAPPPPGLLPARGDGGLTAALAAIDSADVAAVIAELASDAYEGRGTGTPGEQKAVEFIAARMREAGLEGGAPDGTFFQRVPLRGATPVEVSPLTLRPAGVGAPAVLAFVDEFIATTEQEVEAARFDDAELVFVGYGITNPGYDWDDYAGVDVRGKVVVMFVNDPPATAAEPALFQADTMTYNGRWTYKYEEARRHGALGALLVHTDATAGYPFTVLSGDARGEHLGVVEPPEGALALRGWITRASAERLAGMSGATLDGWFAEAATRDFRARTLPVRASLAMTFTQRRGVTGTNVIGVRRGTARPEEGIIYTAHHDHLGRSEELEAQGRDGIFNGAVDNASGVAMLLEIAEAFSSLPERPRRSVYFATLTAEEAGLLGSEFLSRTPPIPLARMVANVNVDSGNLLGPTEDVVGIGAERSQMLRYFREAAAGEGLTVSFDTAPSTGRFFRSDQLAFARGGVPAVFVSTGRRFVGRDAEFGPRAEADYRQNRYHQPSDEWTGTAPLAGLLQQTRVAFRLGHRLATSDLRPTWRPSEPFSITRAESERAAGLTD
jgi:Zn-dependent M28 family amino/carboxypeptidase